jgi:hypothetical protein
MRHICVMLRGLCNVQVEMTVGASKDTKVFVYRNMIKALPW